MSRRHTTISREGSCEKRRPSQTQAAPQQVTDPTADRGCL